MDSEPQINSGPAVGNQEDIKSDMADHADGLSKGVTTDLTKEDEEGLAAFLQNVQGQ